MRTLDSFPILLVDDELHDDTATGRATRGLVERLRENRLPVITATDLADAEQIVSSTPELSCLVIDWDVHHEQNTDAGRNVAVLTPTLTAAVLIKELRGRNESVPIFLLADQTAASTVPVDILQTVTGYIWKLEETPGIVEARIEKARREYLEPLLPPFFGALAKFVNEGRYSWHTPGHSSGAAFLKTPVGAAFHQFFGENTFRSDLSVSVGELGSLLEHTGPIGEAEAEAAETFGADRTMFVTNGTSTANKIVFHSCVQPGDVVLVDRNCHKSVMHAIVMTGAIPVYLQPIRNANGIIGPIPRSGVSPDTVRAAMESNPLVPDGVCEAALAVVTNSTYDGLCYDAQTVLSSLSKTAKRMLFDEAWFGYAHFHPVYARRHAMDTISGPGTAATFATQSTHKLLAAFSQGSMVHVRNSNGLVNPAALEEAFMMHTSTSPQYGIIASLDVASRMMRGKQGTTLIDDAIEEAVTFRRELPAAASDINGDWNFEVWQPPHTTELSDEELRDPRNWELGFDEQWHGYANIGDGHAMLDPIKVTILTPGIGPDGKMQEHGIPAAIVSRFLDERGIVVEKTGSYSFLVLFSLGITKGKSGTLLAELLEFKRHYDSETPLTEALPRLVAEHPEYRGLTLKSLAEKLHSEMLEADVAQLQAAMYDGLPEAVVTPAVAYRDMVGGRSEMLGVEQLAGRISAVMVVPYPPGIPVLMPGERFGDHDSALIRYLRSAQQLDKRVPGFETEIHGVEHDHDGSYLIPCLNW